MAKIFSAIYIAVLVISPFFTAYLIGFNRLFYVVGGTDLALLGEGLAFNSNLSQTFFDHPSFPLYLIIGWYYKFLHFLNLSEIYNFETLYSAQSKNEALQDLVFRLRILAVIICSAYLLVLYSFLKQITNIYCAKIGLLIGATSQGVNVQSIMLRMEILSFIFILLGLICFSKLLQGKKNNFDAFFLVKQFCDFILLSRNGY